MFGLFDFLNVHIEVKIDTEIVQAQHISAPFTAVMRMFADMVKEFAKAGTPGKITVTNLADNSCLTFATEAYLRNFDIEE